MKTFLLYTVETEALDDHERTISRSPRRFDRADLGVVN